ncbi:hypothetical protein KC315_g16 [Hortaea werneckii]|nr:hypothetical protein KC315_g16 [Hortaea werneckii]
MAKPLIPSRVVRLNPATKWSQAVYGGPPNEATIAVLLVPADHRRSTRGSRARDEGVWSLGKRLASGRWS